MKTGEVSFIVAQIRDGDAVAERVFILEAGTKWDQWIRHEEEKEIGVKDNY